MAMEAEKSYDLSSVSQRPRTAGGIIQSPSKGLSLEWGGRPNSIRPSLSPNTQGPGAQMPKGRR